jgi:hypothetical protein
MKKNIYIDITKSYQTLFCFLFLIFILNYDLTLIRILAKTYIFFIKVRIKTSHLKSRKVLFIIQKTYLYPFDILQHFP